MAADSLSESELQVYESRGNHDTSWRQRLVDREAWAVEAGFRAQAGVSVLRGF